MLLGWLRRLMPLWLLLSALLGLGCNQTLRVDVDLQIKVDASLVVVDQAEVE